jgi:hypothetical protein
MANDTVSPLVDSIGFLKDFGFFEVALPLVMIFAIFYGVLLKTKVFGDAGKDAKLLPLYAIVSFSASFFVVASTDVVQMINEIIPSAMVLLVIAFLMLVLFGMFGYTPSTADNTTMTWNMRIILIVLVIIFLGVIDMSMENVEIPIIHDVAGSFYDDGSSGSGSSGSSSGGLDAGLTEEQVDTIIGGTISLAFILGIMGIVMYYAGGGRGPRAPKDWEFTGPKWGIQEIPVKKNGG